MFIDYVESILGEPKWNTAHNEANWDCPFCDDSRTRFRINSEKLVGFCFNCNWSGNAVQFVRDINNVTWTEAYDIVNFYEDFKPLPQDIFEEVFDRLYIDEADIETKKKVVKLPGDFVKLLKTKSIRAKPFLKYARKRGLSDEQIQVHGVGYCPEGELKLPNGKTFYLQNRLIVQVYDDRQRPIYWNARALLKKMKPKSFNPVGMSNTLNKSDVLFNLNNAKKTGVAVLTEGVFDATTIGWPGVSMFGSTLSIRQLLLLLEADLEAVYIMLDPDASDKAVKIAATISQHMSEVYLCLLKNGDPNEVGKKGCLEAIKNAEKFDKFTAIKYKILR